MPDSIFTLEYERFKQLLIKARTNANLTQADVASRLDKPQSFVSKYERGERRIDVIEFLEITDAIGVDPIEFLLVLREETK